MNYIELSIEHLNGEERSEFKAFLTKERENRKDLKLFDILCQTNRPSSREIAMKLYQKVNLNAYHSLRKRLMAQLFTFVVSKRLQADATKASTVMGMISMGQFMLEKRAGSVASYFLNKAEQIALKNGQTDLLGNIYHIQISNVLELNLDIDDVIQKWKENSKRHLSRQKLDIAYALIRKNLSAAKKKGVTLDPEQIIGTVFKDFEITASDANNAAYMYKIVSMTRSAIISTKDYNRLEPFIIRIYKRLKEANTFGKMHAMEELGFLYMIAHVLYRNRKFADAMPWIGLMEQVLPLQSFRASIFYPKYIALRVAIASYSGQNKEAIELMKNLLQGKQIKIVTSERLNLQLNLSVYYFQSADYKKANKAINEIAHSDKWIEDKMGKEWRFKKSMIEVIIQYELGNENTALAKIKALEKNFSGFFANPIYQRAGFFLKFIRRVILDPDIVTTPEFAEEVKQARMGLPVEREDIQAITFFCWLKSKMQKREYYEVLLEAMSRD